MSPEKIRKEDYRTQKLSFEYVLPDYEPTIKRVMLANARLMPNERIALADTVTLSGAVEYRMVYQSVDDELSSLCFSIPYECTLSADEEAKRLVDNAVLSSFSCMPSGPRRVLAKGEVCATLQSIGEEDLQILEDEADLFTLNESFAYTSYVYSADEHREYAETVAELSDADAVVLYSDGAVKIDEARPMKDGAFISGKCLIRALISENGVPRSMSSEIAFEEFLPMGRTLDENSHVRCEGCVKSLSLTVQADEGVSTLVANAVVSFGASVAIEEQLRLPLDAYSTSYELHTLTRGYTLSNEKCTAACKETLQMKVLREDADPSPMQEILYAAPTVQLLECTPKKDAVELALKLGVSLIGTDHAVAQADGAGQQEAETAPKGFGFVRHKAEQAYSLTLPIKGARQGMRVITSLPTVLGVNAFSEEGGFNVCTEVCFSVSLCEQTSVSVCIGVERGEASIDKPKDAVCIVFPDTGDTLWSLAKENHARVSDILRENPHIQCSENYWNTAESLGSAKHVLIP